MLKQNNEEILGSVDMTLITHIHLVKNSVVKSAEMNYENNIELLLENLNTKLQLYFSIKAVRTYFLSNYNYYVH